MPEARRLPPLRREELDEDAQRMWDAATDGQRNAVALNADGSLTGPADVMFRAPRIGLRLAALAEQLETHGVLDTRHSELVILAAAARTRTEFEWWSHERKSRRVGLADDIIDAIAERRDPPLTDDDDRTVYEIASVLCDTGWVPDELYARGEERFGVAGMIELTTLTGFATMMGFIQNSFHVPLPDGEQPRWAR